MKNLVTIQGNDGFKNVIKGLGTKKDARTATTYEMGLRVTQQLASDLYTYNWLCAKVVDTPIDDATRKWRTLLIPDPDKKKEAEELLKSFDVKGKVNLASKWARVYGGAVILAIIDGEDQAEPMDVEKIRPGSLKNFIVLDRYHIFPNSVDNDILSDNFGNPETYTVSENGQEIHHTRLFKFLGVVPTLREYRQQNYWGLSLFTKLFEPISDSQTTSQSISNLVLESNVDVYGIKGLNAMVAEGADDLVVKRLRLAHEMKSIINGIALDQEDDYEKKTNNFASLAQIDQEGKQTVAGASNIPYTRLWGKSPDGMNATGVSDMLNYDDGVQSIQENDMRPPIDWMDLIIMADAGLFEPIQYEFNPLKQLTEVEQATVDINNAQRDQIYLDQDIIQPSDALAELADNGTYITIDENRVAVEKEEEELNEEFDENEFKGEE